MAKARGQPESQLVQAVLARLKRDGHHAWRNSTGVHRIGGRVVPFGAVGSGDVLAVVLPHGRLLSVECKVGKNTATEHQLLWISAVNAAGGVAGVVRGLGDLELLLQEAQQPWRPPVVAAQGRADHA